MKYRYSATYIKGYCVKLLVVKVPTFLPLEYLRANLFQKSMLSPLVQMFATHWRVSFLFGLLGQLLHTNITQVICWQPVLSPTIPCGGPLKTGSSVSCTTSSVKEYYMYYWTNKKLPALFWTSSSKALGCMDFVLLSLPTNNGVAASSGEITGKRSSDTRFPLCRQLSTQRTDTK